MPFPTPLKKPPTPSSRAPSTGLVTTPVIPPKKPSAKPLVFLAMPTARLSWLALLLIASLRFCWNFSIKCCRSQSLPNRSCDLADKARTPSHHSAEDGPHSNGKPLGKLTRTLDCALEGFVEEIFNTASHANYNTKRIPKDVKSKQDDVHLLDGLTCVVAGNLRGEVVEVEELVLALEIGQPEDDVVGVGDCNAETLKQQIDEVGASGHACAVPPGVVRGEAQADVHFERGEVEVVVEVLVALTHTKDSVLLQLLSRHVQVGVQLLRCVLLQDLFF